MSVLRTAVLTHFRDSGLGPTLTVASGTYSDGVLGDIAAHGVRGADSPRGWAQGAYLRRRHSRAEFEDVAAHSDQGSGEAGEASDEQGHAGIGHARNDAADQRAEWPNAEVHEPICP